MAGDCALSARIASGTAPAAARNVRRFIGSYSISPSKVRRSGLFAGTMASSSRGVGQRKLTDMTTIPAALRERLGPEATGGLLQLLETSHREWRADVMVSCTERFERRLAEEVAGLRVQI